ncbi:ferredoxin-like protein FixX [Salana multivorans]|uniref:Ferredoxin-like protein FixX n=1 Tax=Salana multivorans TaxID=120377 RepID=A0A3N2DCX8_9MICO|nr:4Fe-4S dicluster domain-containing protein [Salana multivorans]MBN8883970.1 4Fe-4S dicluster domain-containing protein [Salana multivorans]OJX98002.1 MAG: hypothetical protein BGO96_14050 [Micrococcales bacterium 73-15]ROR97645.1 ferredoxin-like protein FixX [Salana multivorans]
MSEEVGGEARDAGRPGAPALNVLLGATAFDAATPHIDTSAMDPRSPETAAVIAVCPAGVYRVSRSRETDEELVVADEAACLECGACLVVSSGGLRWGYPESGGVRFRHG